MPIEYRAVVRDSEASTTNDKKSSNVDSEFALVVTSHTLNSTYSSLLPILYPAMTSEFNLSYGLVGILVMGYRLSSGGLQLVMGLIGTFVRKRILLGLGMIWQCIANSLMAISQQFDSLFPNRALVRIGRSPAPYRFSLDERAVH